MNSVGVKRRFVTGVTCLIGVIAAGGACTRKAAPKTEQSGVETTAPAKSADAIPADPVEAALHQIVTHCGFNEQHAVISRCENNEKQSAIRDFNTGKLSRTAAFPILVDALGSTERKRSIAASKLFESAFRNSFGTNSQVEVDKAAAAKMVNLLATLPERQVVQIAPAAVHAAMLTGQQAALYKVLDESPHKELRSSAYVYLLRYGTLAELPKIQSLVQGDDERVATSALEALRRMPAQRPEDLKTVCEFVKPLAEDPRGPVAGKAISQMVTCGGEYIDAALAAAEAARKESKLTAPVVRGLDQTCIQHRGQASGSTQQCARLRTLLEGTLSDTKAGEEARQFALLSLGMQFPDEGTSKLAEKYTSSEDKRLKSAAERVVRSVSAKLKQTKAGNGPKLELRRDTLTPAPVPSPKAAPETPK